MHSSRSRCSCPPVVIFLFLVCVLTHGTPLHAQALLTASKESDISGFGGFSYENPDFGPQTANHNTGGTVGLDLTRYLFSNVASSLEARGTYAAGPYVSEHTFAVGLNFATQYRRRFHPYVDFLAGFGVIKFLTAGPGLHSDRSTIYSFGGGVDIDIVHRVSLKADIQGSHWDLGHVQLMNQTFAPMIATVGVAYRIPFRAHNRQADLQ